MSTIEIVDDQGNTQQVPIPKENTKTVGLGSNDGQNLQHLARHETGQHAAAAVAGELLADFAARPSTPGQQEAAIRLLGELGTPTPKARMGEEQPAAPAAEAPAGPTVEEAVAPLTLPDDYELPAELAAELDQPDDDEPESTVEPLADEPPPTWDDEEYAADPRLEQARAQVAAAERKAEHERQLRVDAQKPAWRDEAKRVFRLGEIELVSDEELDAIDAASHREFLRQARAVADRNKAVVKRFAPQAAAAPAAASAVEAPTGQVDLEAERARIREEERVRLEREQWGPPTTGGGRAETLPLDVQRRLERARQNGNIKDLVRHRLFGN